MKKRKTKVVQIAPSKEMKSSDLQSLVNKIDLDSGVLLLGVELTDWSLRRLDHGEVPEWETYGERLAYVGIVSNVIEVIWNDVSLLGKIQDVVLLKGIMRLEFIANDDFYRIFFPLWKIAPNVRLSLWQKLFDQIRQGEVWFNVDLVQLERQLIANGLNEKCVFRHFDDCTKVNVRAVGASDGVEIERFILNKDRVELYYGDADLDPGYEGEMYAYTSDDKNIFILFRDGVVKYELLIPKTDDNGVILELFALRYVEFLEKQVV